MRRLEVLNEYMQSFAEEYKAHESIFDAWDVNYKRIREMRKNEDYDEFFVEILDRYNDYVEACYREG